MNRLTTPAMASRHYDDVMRSIHTVNGELSAGDLAGITRLRLLTAVVCQSVLDVGMPDDISALDIAAKDRLTAAVVDQSKVLLAAQGREADFHEIYGLALFAHSGQFGQIVSPDQYLEAIGHGTESAA